MVRNIQESKNPGGSNHFEQVVHQVIDFNADADADDWWLWHQAVTPAVTHMMCDTLQRTIVP